MSSRTDHKPSKLDHSRFVVELHVATLLGMTDINILVVLSNNI